MKKTKKKTKDFNSFDRTVEMLKSEGANCLLVENIDKSGMVTAVPYNSKTGVSWAMAMISSVEELFKSKYKKAVPNNLVKIYETLTAKL